MNAVFDEGDQKLGANGRGVGVFAICPSTGRCCAGSRRPGVSRRRPCARAHFKGMTEDVPTHRFQRLAHGGARGHGRRGGLCPLRGSRVAEKGPFPPTTSSLSTSRNFVPTTKRRHTMCPFIRAPGASTGSAGISHDPPAYVPAPVLEQRAADSPGRRCAGLRRRCDFPASLSSSCPPLL